MTLDDAIDRTRTLVLEHQDLVFNGQEILDLAEMLEELKRCRDLNK